MADQNRNEDLQVSPSSVAGKEEISKMTPEGMALARTIDRLERQYDEAEEPGGFSEGL
jgi:hypothetical protein